MNRKALTLFAAIITMCAVVSGCASSDAGAAGGAGGYTWARGKLSFTVSHDIGTCHNAAILALTDLEITVVGDTTDRLAGRIMGETSLGESVIVDLEPKGLEVTKIEIRVGVVGSEGQSKIIADAIKRQL